MSTITTAFTAGWFPGNSCRSSNLLAPFWNGAQRFPAGEDGMDFEKDNFEDDNELSRLENDEELGGETEEIVEAEEELVIVGEEPDRKSTRLNSSHSSISYAVFCLKKKKKKNSNNQQQQIKKKKTKQ